MPFVYPGPHLDERLGLDLVRRLRAPPLLRASTTTVAFMPGWSVQNRWNVPAFGNAYVAVAGGAFGPCGDRPPLDTGVEPEIVFGPNGQNACPL